MRNLSGIWSFVVACVVMATAQTHAQAPTHKPYKPVEVEFTKPLAEPSFAAFRKQLAALAKRADRDALKSLADPDFFIDNDIEGLFNPKRAATDNLFAALRLDKDPVRGFAQLAAFAEEPSVGAPKAHRKTWCAPAPPRFDDAELYPLMEETGSDVADWHYPRQAGLAVRVRPEANAAVIEKLELALVRVLGFSRTRDDDTRRLAWAKIVTPSGKVGYVAPGALLSPVSNRLCFTKNGADWNIAGYVSGGD